MLGKSFAIRRVESASGLHQDSLIAIVLLMCFIVAVISACQISTAQHVLPTGHFHTTTGHASLGSGCLAAVLPIVSIWFDLQWFALTMAVLLIPITAPISPLFKPPRRTIALLSP